MFSFNPVQANVDMAMQPDGQTALHIAADQAKIDTAMLEVNNVNLIICTKKTLAPQII